VPVVEPVNPAEDGQFQNLDVAPWSLAMNQLSFVETAYRFREGVVVTVTDATDSLLDASFGQTLCISNGQILPAAIRAMNQSAFLDVPLNMQGLFQASSTKSVLADCNTRNPTIAVSKRVDK